ncbi:MAG: nicotinate (nicotinamide) nucleotide adenylyltransferase [Burkholderiales bacterium]|nr:nicotinate (nicotinamide) nucleotide adenylyltransferase [Burkholderiales bacterium]
MAHCVLVLGGSYDPVHLGHVALARCLTNLLHPDELRIIPAGQPWQKSPLTATAQQRIEMLELAFEDWIGCSISIDKLEIQKALDNQVNYTIETLRQLRSQLGEHVSIVFAIGADQLQNLHTWYQWKDLFSVAHLIAVARPGSSLEIANPDVAAEWKQREMSIHDLRSRATGGTFIEKNLAQDVSATQLRLELKQCNPTTKLPVPHKVLDYLKQHSIYSKNGH